MSLAEWSSTLGGFSDFVASFAVLVTLIYLAKQIRQAKQQLELVGLQTRANQAAAVLDPIASSADIAPIFAKLDLVNYGEFGLSKEESIRFGAWFHMWLQTEQGSFYMLPKGSTDALLTWMLATPAGAEFWNKNKGIYDPPFVAHVEDLRRRLERTQKKGNDVLRTGA